MRARRGSGPFGDVSTRHSGMTRRSFVRPYKGTGRHVLTYTDTSYNDLADNQTRMFKRQLDILIIIKTEKGGAWGITGGDTGRIGSTFEVHSPSHHNHSDKYINKSHLKAELIILWPRKIQNQTYGQCNDETHSHWHTGAWKWTKPCDIKAPAFSQKHGNT